MEKSQFPLLGSRAYYKPFATRSPVLIFLLLVTITLIGLIEYACRIIPVHVGVGKLGNVLSNISDIEKRQTQIYSPTTDLPGLSPTPVSTSYPVTSTPSGGYLSLGDDSPPSTTGAPQSGYLSVGSEPTYIPPGAPNSGYLSVGNNDAPSGIVTGTPDSGYLSVGNSVYPTPASGYLDVGAPTDGPGAKPDPGEGSQTVTSNYQPVVVVSDGTTMTLASPTPFIVVENGVTSTQTPALIQPTPTPGAPNSGYLEATDTSAPAPSATIVNSTGTYLVYKDGQTIPAPQITLKQYLLVSFAPLIVAVLFTIPWRIVDTTLREMEPFYQLHREGGARAEHSLCLDYSTSWLLATPFKAGFRGHVFVFWSSLISVAVLALAPLSSETFFVSLSGHCGPNMPPCRATWGVYLVLARVVEGILAFIAVLVALILLFGFRRKSGVYSEPLSIAGLAALFHDSPLLRGFREIDSRVNNEQLKEILAGKRYGISPFTTYDNRQCYGILPADPDSEAGFAGVARVGKKGQYRLVDSAEVPRDAFGMPINGEVIEDRVSLWGRIKPHLLYCSVFVLVTGLLTLITYYHWSNAQDGFEWFMDSQGFGVRFMMAGLGVLLKSLWSTVDEDLRKLEPYHRLLLGSAKPEDSILVPVWMDPFSALIPSLARGHLVISLICFVSILSEFLPIALANISFSPAMTKAAYTGCTYVAMAILIIMFISILILMFRPRHHIRPLPRKPTTLASILLYITNLGEGDGPALVDEMEGLSMLGTKERNVHVKALGNSYTMGVGARNDLRVDVDRRIRRLWADM